VGASNAHVEAAVFTEVQLAVEVVKVLTKLLVVWVLAGEVPRLPHLWEGETVKRYLTVYSGTRVL